MIVFLTTLLILLCLAIVLLILIQRTSGGMGSALGGGAADQYLGAGSAAQLTKLTVWGILFFFILSFGLYALYQNEAGVDDQLLRSENTLPEVIPSDLPLPEASILNLESEDIPVQNSTDSALDAPIETPSIPTPAAPVTSGNSSE